MSRRRLNTTLYKVLYTSGTRVTSLDYEEVLIDMNKPDVIAELKNASSDEEKTEIVIELGEMPEGEMPEGATLTWDGLIGTMTYPLNQEDLEDFTERKQPYDLFNNEDAVIKTNADKTKYTITISNTTQTYYLEKN